jgi:hypothetical protein
VSVYSNSLISYALPTFNRSQSHTLSKLSRESKVINIARQMQTYINEMEASASCSSNMVFLNCKYVVESTSKYYSTDSALDDSEVYTGSSIDNSVLDTDSAYSAPYSDKSCLASFLHVS